MNSENARMGLWSVCSVPIPNNMQTGGGGSYPSKSDMALSR